MSRKQTVNNFCIVFALLFIFTTGLILYQINHTLFIDQTPIIPLANGVYENTLQNETIKSQLNIPQTTLQQQIINEPSSNNNLLTTMVPTVNKLLENKGNTNGYDLKHILHMRTHSITNKCVNPYTNDTIKQYKLLNISNLPLNMVPFLNRCELNKTIFTRNHAEWHEMFINSKLGYIHNYKVAGTTIQESFHKLGKSKYFDNAEYIFNHTGDIMRWCEKFLNYTKYWDKKNEWYSLMSDIFLFTLVRDPIDRLLSAYFEINTRNLYIFERNNIDHLHGINKFRALMGLFYNNTKKYLLSDFMNKYIVNKNKPFKMKELWSGEAHLHPQTIFLLNLDLEYFPFDYIGDLKYFDDIMSPIMQEFVSYLSKEPRYYRGALKMYRNRESRWYYGDSLYEDYNIKRDNLTDDDVRLICEVYWIDYICLPFDIPKQCNITDLLIKHYGKHVTYNDCYFS